MSVEILTATREVTLTHKLPNGDVQWWPLKPHVFTEMPTDVFAALKAKKGSRGRSPLECYLDDRTISHVTPQVAQAMVEGKIPMPADLSPLPALQQVAQETKSMSAVLRTISPTNVAETLESAPIDFGEGEPREAARDAERALMREPPAPRRGKSS